MDISDLKTIPLDTLSNNYRWSLHQDLNDCLCADISESIEKFGIIHPPFVRKCDTGSYEMVCGARRVRAAIAVLKKNEVLCQVLHPSVSKATILQLVAKDQHLSGPLSAIEKARFTAICTQMLPTDQAKQVFFQAGMGSNEALQRLSSLLTLEQSIMDAIHEGLISDKTGLDFLSMTSEDRLFLCALFRALSLNRNKQRRLIDMGRSIISNGNSNFLELFSNYYPELLPGKTIDNIPQTVHSLLKDLHRRSKPMSSNVEREFNSQIKSLKLPKNCSISHSQAFEKDDVTLMINFRNMAGLIKKWEAVRDLLNDDGDTTGKC